MGWLRLAGSLKSQVSFAEYSLFYRALLQKRHIILRSLLIVASPAHKQYLHHRLGLVHFHRVSVCVSVRVFTCVNFCHHGVYPCEFTYVSFAKELYKRDYTLQKRPTFLRSLYHSHPIPCLPLNNIVLIITRLVFDAKRTATHCNTLQHTATHCNTLIIATLYHASYLITSSS